MMRVKSMMPVKQFPVTIVYYDRKKPNKKLKIEGPDLHTAAVEYVKANLDVAGVLHNGRWVD